MEEIISAKIKKEKGKLYRVKLISRWSGCGTFALYNLTLQNSEEKFFWLYIVYLSPVVYDDI